MISWSVGCVSKPERHKPSEFPLWRIQHVDWLSLEKCVCASYLVMSFNTGFICRVSFRAKDAEFAHLVQGGDAVTFLKSKEDQNSRRLERWERMWAFCSRSAWTTWVFSQNSVSTFSYLFMPPFYRLHRLKKHGSFFRQGQNEAAIA